MTSRPLEIPEVIVFEPRVFGDDRGGLRKPQPSGGPGDRHFYKTLS